MIIHQILSEVRKELDNTLFHPNELNCLKSFYAALSIEDKLTSKDLWNNMPTLVKNNFTIGFDKMIEQWTYLGPKSIRIAQFIGEVPELTRRVWIEELYREQGEHIQDEVETFIGNFIATRENPNLIDDFDFTMGDDIDLVMHILDLMGKYMPSCEQEVINKEYQMMKEQDLSPDDIKEMRKEPLS